MSVARLAASFDVEFRHAFRRPLFIIMALMIALTAYGLSSGSMRISSGDSTVGGTKAWITSEFAQTQTMTYLTLLYYAFFVSVAAGLTLLRDREVKVDTLLHATPLTPGEYVGGRFLAAIAAFSLMLLWQAACAAFFNHAIPNANAAEMRGPFDPLNYLVPLLTIGVPFLIFFTGLSMLVGETSRSAVLVFVAPVAALLVCGFFLWTWSPSWLGLTLNRVLQVAEPSAYRWLNETHLKVDRGVAFYNTSAVPYDALFWLNRAWLVVLGLGAVLLARRSMARSARGVAGAVRGSRRDLPAPDAPWSEAPTAVRGLGMTSGIPTALATVRDVAATELRELRRQAGLYIFIPLILIQTIGNVLLAVGAFDTPLLLTPGLTAVAVANQISFLVCLLLMFYTVESLERERTTGFAQILYASPARTGAILAGKALANSLVAGFVLVASLAACAVALAVQHTVPFSLTPYVLVWGLLLVPTFLAWTAFVTACYAVVGNRYAAYGVSFAALAFTGYRLFTNKISWAGNWPLWNALRWSDLGFFETDRMALLLNRFMTLGLAVFFTAFAVRFFARRGPDAVRTMHRLAPRRIAAAALRLSPYALVPAAACVSLGFMVSQGLEGGAARKAERDYWAKNLKTWLDAPLPDIARLDVDLDLEPARHGLRSRGTWTLVNPHEEPLARIPVTTGRHWEHVAWTLDGAAHEPEESQHLLVFTLPRPLATGDSVVIGWSMDGRFPGGVTKNGGNTDEFILPSGVVLTGFSPSFMPVLGFMEGVGESDLDKNRTEPRRYPRDYWKGVTRAGYGATAWFPARVSVTAPQEYTLNSVGNCTSDTVTNGRRTQVWETDHPVKIVNVVAGRWNVKRGEGTAIYYHAAHDFNVEEMSRTLEASRRWYGTWFAPYPWRELKLSEFPALAAYAQGFGTNITFSENIGFLTKNDVKTDATFLVTAHEAAHQWWGNILTPANGPGGDFLSEAAAHFSTLLLFEEVKGPRARMEFAKGLEARYSDRRQADDERPMYDVDGKRRHDTTVIYDRGGWVFWMLYDHLGAERAREAYRNFFREWSASRDHPALQDFVGALRPYAADTTAYDVFVKQWFEDKVVPQYRVADAKKETSGEGYTVTVTVENTGTGTMPVEVAAAAGERWKKPETKDGTYTLNPEYRDARVTRVLAPGAPVTLTLHCDFDPQTVVVDPDVRVLQLKRKQATAKL